MGSGLRQIFVGATGFRPPFLPRTVAAFNPACVRSTTCSRGPVSTFSESSISRMRSFRIKSAFFPKRQIDIIPEKWEESNQRYQCHFKRISKILRRIRYLCQFRAEVAQRDWHQVSIGCSKKQFQPFKISSALKIRLSVRQAPWYRQINSLPGHQKRGSAK